MKRDNFGTRLGLLAAAAGSAVGLGNIWKFPYITGKNGGAAFILVYLLCITLIGIPVMLSEFALGRKTQANAVEAFKKVEPKKKWHLAGVLSVSTAFIILSYYAIIAGWIFNYITKSMTGKLSNVEPSALGDYFGGIISKTGEPLFFNFLVIGLTTIVVIAGVKKGVEKYSKILMPILFLLLVVLMVRSLTLDGASKGLEFLFKPDFSQLTTAGVLEALGHSFYSLSLGMGIIMTYGSYIKKEENLVSLAFQVTILDTLVALMAGIVIFPAVFAYGLEPNQGPALIFVTLPAVFKAMPFGAFFETLFFVLIAIAAITSTISLLEVVVAFFTEKFNMERKRATILISIAVFIVGIPSTLSFGAWSNVKIFGKSIFDSFDFLTSNIFLPMGGILVCVFVGWVWGTKNAAREISSDGTYSFKLCKVYSFIVKVLAPVAIGIIFLYFTGIMSKLARVGSILPSIALAVLGLLTFILVIFFFKTERSGFSDEA